MAMSLSSPPPLPPAPQQADPLHTRLPVEVWVTIFTRLSELPGQSLAPLAAICNGWQYEIEKLTFRDLVVHTDEHDMALLRRVVTNSDRAGCLSTITLSARVNSSQDGAEDRTHAKEIQQLMARSICQFMDCLGNAAWGHHQRSLTLGFDGFGNAHDPSYILQENNPLTRRLRLQGPTRRNIGRIVLSLQENRLPASLFADIVRFCSADLKSLDLTLVAETGEDATLYNTHFMTVLQYPLQNSTLEELNLVHPPSVDHQEDYPSTYRCMMGAVVKISRKLLVLRVASMAADVFFNMSKNVDWPNLHTLEISSTTLGGTATTFFQEDYLENAVAIVTKVAEATGRMKNLQRLLLQQRLWPYYDDIWDLDIWAWMDVELNVHHSQSSSKATVAKLRVRGVEPEDKAIEAWEDAISKDRGIPLDCEVGWHRHQHNARIRRIMNGGW